MPRRNSYRIAEGSYARPFRLYAHVGRHGDNAGRISVPPSLIGLVVEIHVPLDRLDISVLRGGEPPRAHRRKGR